MAEWMHVLIDFMALIFSSIAFMVAMFRDNARSDKEMEKRVALLEQSQKQQLTSRDMEGMRSEMSRLTQTIATLEGALEVTTRTVERMNQFLMERGHA